MVRAFTDLGNHSLAHGLSLVLWVATEKAGGLEWIKDAFALL